MNRSPAPIPNTITSKQNRDVLHDHPPLGTLPRGLCGPAQSSGEPPFQAPGSSDPGQPDAILVLDSLFSNRLCNDSATRLPDIPKPRPDSLRHTRTLALGDGCRPDIDGPVVHQGIFGCTSQVRDTAAACRPQSARCRISGDPGRLLLDKRSLPAFGTDHNLDHPLHDHEPSCALPHRHNLPLLWVSALGAKAPCTIWRRVQGIPKKGAKDHTFAGKALPTQELGLDYTPPDAPDDHARRFVRTSSILLNRFSTTRAGFGPLPLDLLSVVIPHHYCQHVYAQH